MYANIDENEAKNAYKNFINYMRKQYAKSLQCGELSEDEYEVIYTGMLQKMFSIESCEKYDFTRNDSFHRYALKMGLFQKYYEIKRTLANKSAKYAILGNSREYWCFYQSVSQTAQNGLNRVLNRRAETCPPASEKQRAWFYKHIHYNTVNSMPEHSSKNDSKIRLMSLLYNTLEEHERRLLQGWFRIEEYENTTRQVFCANQGISREVHKQRVEAILKKLRGKFDFLEERLGKTW